MVQVENNQNTCIPDSTVAIYMNLDIRMQYADLAKKTAFEYPIAYDKERKALFFISNTHLRRLCDTKIIGVIMKVVYHRLQ